MIYLDNAATTLYKPRAVEQAVRRAMYGAAAGAGRRQSLQIGKKTVNTLYRKPDLW